MHYRSYRPGPELERFVECYWVLRSDSDLQYPAGAEVIAPDGCMEMIVNLGKPFTHHGESGTSRVQPVSFMVGQLTRGLMIEPSELVDIIAVRFRPGGAYPFLRFPQFEIADRFLDLASIWGDRAGSLRLALIEQAGTRGRIRVVEQFLLGSLDEFARNSFVLTAANIVRASRGGVEMESLCRGAGVGLRQFERRFRNEVGIPPKLLARIARFQFVLELAGECSDNWATIAAEGGYYDQAHLIRDFRQFTGSAPAALLSTDCRLTRQFSALSRSNSYNTRLALPC